MLGSVLDVAGDLDFAVQEWLDQVGDGTDDRLHTLTCFECKETS